MATKTAASVRRAATKRASAAKGMDPALFAELLESVKEGGAILRGERPAARRYVVDTSDAPRARTAPKNRTAVDRIAAETLNTGTVKGADPDVAVIRARLKLSQEKFAALLGISRRTLEQWEQGRRAPTGPARVLLRVAELHPRAVLETQRP